MKRLFVLAPACVLGSLLALGACAASEDTTGGGGSAGFGGSAGSDGGGTGGAEPTFTPDPQGCKCRVPSGRDATPGGWALAGLAALAFGARRRRAG